jgi:hypothetical protein
MAISSAALFIVLIALPFGGSCLAALFRANARNADAYLAGGVALTALVLVIAIYPQVVNGGVVQYRAAWVPELGPLSGAWLHPRAVAVVGSVAGIGSGSCSTRSSAGGASFACSKASKPRNARDEAEPQTQSELSLTKHSSAPNLEARHEN